MRVDTKLSYREFWKKYVKIINSLRHPGSDEPCLGKIVLRMWKGFKKNSASSYDLAHLMLSVSDFLKQIVLEAVAESMVELIDDNREKHTTVELLSHKRATDGKTKICFIWGMRD